MGLRGENNTKKGVARLRSNNVAKCDRLLSHFDIDIAHAIATEQGCGIMMIILEVIIYAQHIGNIQG